MRVRAAALVRGIVVFSPPDDIYSSAAWLRVSLAGGDNEWVRKLGFKKVPFSTPVCKYGKQSRRTANDESPFKVDVVRAEYR